MSYRGHLIVCKPKHDNELTFEWEELTDFIDFINEKCVDVLPALRYTEGSSILEIDMDRFEKFQAAWVLLEDSEREKIHIEFRQYIKEKEEYLAYGDPEILETLRNQKESDFFGFKERYMRLFKAYLKCEPEWSSISFEFF